MAELVLGVGTSHGPLLSTPPDQWNLRAQADRTNKEHYFRGDPYDYESLLKAREPGFAHELDPEKKIARYDRCQRALDTLARKIKEVAPDTLVIVGNDQREMFTAELTPAITVYRGEQIENIPFDAHHLGPGLGIAEAGNCPPGGATYPSATALADHIVRTLGEADFDPAQCNVLPKHEDSRHRHGIPHAYGFFYHRVMADDPPPSVPVILNVHYPHNRPTVRRCLSLGRAIRTAIKSWDTKARVAMIASGGLSHFVIDEELDYAVLEAMETRNEDGLARIPESHFRAGTAEIKNWFPVIAAMNAEGRRFHKVDYVPCYRSEAGTGNAMGFIYWD